MTRAKNTADLLRTTFEVGDHVRVVRGDWERTDLLRGWQPLYPGVVSSVGLLITVVWSPHQEVYDYPPEALERIVPDDV